MPWHVLANFTQVGSLLLGTANVLFFWSAGEHTGVLGLEQQLLCALEAHGMGGQQLMGCMGAARHRGQHACTNTWTSDRVI